MVYSITLRGGGLFLQEYHMTNNPMTRDTQEADDEPMVMVNLNGSSEDDERMLPAPEPEPKLEPARNGQECTFGGGTSDSDSEDDAPIPAGPHAPAHESGLPPVPLPPPPPTIGFQNLVLAIQIALESAEAGPGTAAQKRRSAITLIRAMVDDAGPAPGTPSASGFQAFLASEALEGVVDLVLKAARGEVRVAKGPPTRAFPCLQALRRWALGGRKN